MSFWAFSAFTLASLLFSISTMANPLPGPPQLASPGSAQTFQGGTISVEPLKGPFPKDSIPEDMFSMIVGTKTDAYAAELHFESAYGQFHLFAVPLRNSNEIDYVLVTARGRGTEATEFFLDIYQLNGNHFDKRYEKKISGYAGRSTEWWYDIDFEVMQSGTEQVILTLHSDSSLELVSDHGEVVPADINSRIYWDANMAKFVESKFKS